MSAQEVRQALADAASTVEGITCHPNFVQNMKPGTALVRLDHIDYPNVFGGVRTWQIAVILPQDFAAAERFVDEMLPDLLAAVQPLMSVQKVTPAQLALEQGTVPVVFVEGLREE